MNTGKRQRRNANIQLFFAIVFYVCCLYKIHLNEEHLNTVFSFLNDVFFYRLFAILLLTINAIALIFVMRKQGLLELRNYHPSLFYLLFSFVFYPCLNPFVLFSGSVFIVGILYNSFDLEGDNINRKIFHYSFAVGILALIHPPFIILLLFAYLTCITYRRFSFRIFLLPIIGVFLPILYKFSMLYIIGNDFSIPKNMPQIVSLLDFHNFKFTEISFMLIFAILLLIISLKLIHTLFVIIIKTSIWRRKKQYILLALFLFSLVFAFLYAQFYLEIALIMYSIVLSLHLMQIKMKR